MKFFLKGFWVSYSLLLQGKFVMIKNLEIDEFLNINAVIRANFNFFEEQMLYDHCEVELKKEFGEEWVVAKTGKTLKQIAIDDGKFKLSLEKILQKASNEPDWHFQTTELDFPKPTLEWTASQTGLDEGLISRLKSDKKKHNSGATGGQPFLVQDLLALAIGFNTSVQAFLIPPVNSWDEKIDILFQAKFREKIVSTSLGAWFLWLHNLKALPEQHQYLYERNNSYVGVTPVQKHGNAEVFRGDLLEQFAKSRFGHLSHFESVEDFAPTSDHLVNVLDPLKINHLAMQISTIHVAIGLLVELRKLLRRETAEGPESQLEERIETGMPKIQNYVRRLVRLLRNL
jgi:hypothetical protein